jgi:hypothetical protein
MHHRNHSKSTDAHRWRDYVLALFWSKRDHLEDWKGLVSRSDDVSMCWEPAEGLVGTQNKQNPS